MNAFIIHKPYRTFLNLVSILNNRNYSFYFKIDKEGEDKVAVQDVLLELRRFRMGLIQTVDQLYFSYQAIIEGMKRMNNSVS